MRDHYRASLWAVSGAHAVAAGVTWVAGVPVATPFMLALAAVVAFALGLTGSPGTDDGGHPQLGRATSSRRGEGIAHDGRARGDLRR